MDDTIPDGSNAQPDVVIIGGGATGCGLAWDLSLRGLSVALVEKGDLASGTTGRFHGLLHSGARYVVSDPVTAGECYKESAILRRIVKSAIDETGGLFVFGDEDDPRYLEQWLKDAERRAFPSRRPPSRTRVFGSRPLIPASNGPSWSPTRSATQLPSVPPWRAARNPSGRNCSRFIAATGSARVTIESRESASRTCGRGHRGSLPAGPP